MRPVDYARALFKYIDMDSPPVDIEKMLKILGVELYFDDFDEIQGIAYGSEGKRTIIVNRNLSMTRRRFTIAHELGHILIPRPRKDRLFMDKIIPFGKQVSQSPIEISANRFAAEILMPKPMVDKLWEKYSTNPKYRPEVVAEILQVSETAFRLRMRELKLR